MQGTDGAVPGGRNLSEDTTVTESQVEPVSGLDRCRQPPIVSEFTIARDDLALVPTMRATPSVRIEPDAPTTGAPGTEYLFFNAYGDDLEAFESALSDDPTVDDAVIVGQYDDHGVYRVRVRSSATTVTEFLTALAVRVLAVESERDAWQLRVQLPDRDALLAFREHCQDRGITFRLRKLTTADHDAVGNRLGLSDRQHRTMRTALERGYYDVPREISQEELAETLGISPSAVSQRLRLAVGCLLEETVAGD